MAAPVTVTFEGEQTIRTITEAAAHLRAAMDGADAIEIDCGGVGEVDLSFIQLLLAARKSALRDGRKLALGQPATGELLARLRSAGFVRDELDQALSLEAGFWMKKGEN